MRIVKLLVLVIAGMFVYTQVSAEIIRVPQDRASIGDAVERANSRDTVLVDDGVWDGRSNRRITIDQSRLTIMSVNGPEDCIIDAEEDRNNYVFQFGDFTILRGFTIRDALKEVIKTAGAQSFRIINCRFESSSADSSTNCFDFSGGSGSVEYCTFAGNNGGPVTRRNLQVNTWAGMIHVNNRADIVFEGCYFSRNTCDSVGGAIWATGSSEITIRNCIFRDNSVIWHGGAVGLSSNSDAVISFSNFLTNTARNWGGALYKDGNSHPVIRNSIFWGNEANTGSQIAGLMGGEANRIDITNCIVEGGEDLEGGWYGDEIIEQNARYERGRNPMWGINGFYLNQDCVAIDAGSDDVEELEMENFTTSVELTPDEGTVDIGFHYNLDLFPKLGVLSGYVYDAEDNGVMQGAAVRTSLGQSAITSGEGRWLIAEAFADTVFDLTASYNGYNDSTLTGVELAENESLELNFSLYHPEILLSLNEIVARADSGDTGTVDLMITNSGNGPLHWSSAFEVEGADRPPWTLVNSLRVGETVEDNRMQGVVFVDSLFYVPGANDDFPNTMYMFNRRGELVDTFAQFGPSGYGMSDLTFDGELIWGTEDDSVYGFTPTGDLVYAWEGPINPVKQITWDSDRGVLWISSTTSNIFGFDREGNQVVEDPLPRNGLRLYGLAYYSDDPDGCQLYIITRRSNDDAAYIYKMNVDAPEPDTILVRSVNLPTGAAIGGSITKAYDPYCMNFLIMANASPQEGGDRVNIFHLAGNVSWLMMDPDADSIPPETERLYRISMYNPSFRPGTYRGRLIITHNALRSPARLPLTFIIDRVVSVSRKRPELPVTTAIESAYPNPFNSEITLNYSIARSGSVKLTVFDLAGREIAVLEDGFMKAGFYTFPVNSANWSTGVYLVQMKTADVVKTIKIACIK